MGAGRPPSAVTPPARPPHGASEGDGQRRLLARRSALETGFFSHFCQVYLTDQWARAILGAPVDRARPMRATPRAMSPPAGDCPLELLGM